MDTVTRLTRERQLLLQAETPLSEPIGWRRQVRQVIWQEEKENEEEEEVKKMEEEKDYIKLHRKNRYQENCWLVKYM